jgi:hypothetical protein
VPDESVHAVQLRPTTVPVFPDECVVCGAPSPASTFWYVTRDGMQGRAFWAGWLSRRVPACRGCGLRVQLGIAWGFVRTVVVGIGSLALTAWLLHERLAELPLGLTCFGVTVASLVALVIWERTHPPVFSIELDGAGVAYRFRESALAVRFARANGLTVEDPIGD